MESGSQRHTIRGENWWQREERRVITVRVANMGMGGGGGG